MTEVWVDHPAVDFLVALVAALVVALVAPRLLSDQPETRAVFFQTIAGVGGILLSLGSIVITLLFTVTPNDRLRLVLDAVGSRLQSIAVRCLTAVLIATVALALLVLVKGDATRVLVATTAALLTLASLRFGRLWWMLGRVLAVLSRRDERALGAEPWQRPEVGPDDYSVPQRPLRSDVEP